MRDGDATAVADHWEGVYAEKRPDEVGWYEPSPERSLALIRAAGLGPDAGIIDVGGGASRLAQHLVEAGHSDVTVADIARASLERAREGVGDAVEWVVADVRDHDFGRSFDLWHDRAVFHFMAEADDRSAYLRTLRRSLGPGGFVVIATFGPDGPDRCSGLPVQRYGADELAGALGEDFRVVESGLAQHTTPSGKPQQFLHLVAQRTR